MAGLGSPPVLPDNGFNLALILSSWSILPFGGLVLIHADDELIICSNGSKPSLRTPTKCGAPTSAIPTEYGVVPTTWLSSVTSAPSGFDVTRTWCETASASPAGIADGSSVFPDAEAAPIDGAVGGAAPGAGPAGGLSVAFGSGATARGATRSPVALESGRAGLRLTITLRATGAGAPGWGLAAPGPGVPAALAEPGSRGSGSAAGASGAAWGAAGPGGGDPGAWAVAAVELPDAGGGVVAGGCCG